ncbi:dihydroxyacetone kinase subunit DhaK [Variovorax arabinosiphilus]|uniref:dihydroxyacetone kinase subunit DhaK n=1 Tax=Variovorax arabinosiphilus TaxID=3053498 RepID=UPI002578D7DC|nr:MULTISPECIES: dihydroxyacetone kinase subunit DhaK [unclassified Variovorax]MDM0122607.1 dihydroxyacetone kinase subunit DhaK [Variovorax sp. J2L1-78]MDM0130864.1 dihydroxyacetone kinase subunit DhaK [Variovorax sp. J2L1-63]MDM0235371.1 dihydroxyacetone kinase subunit DhaK [Variovorax sp. J2R1-6]
MQLYGNYGGDRINFDMAAEMLELEGMATVSVRMCDDVARATAAQCDKRRRASALVCRHARRDVRLNALDGKPWKRRSRCHARQVRHAGRTGVARDARHVGGVFKRCAQATAEASGSSLGTLLTVALMTGAKRCAGMTSLGRARPR